MAMNINLLFDRLRKIKLSMKKFNDFFNRKTNNPASNTDWFNLGAIANSISTSYVDNFELIENLGSFINKFKDDNNSLVFNTLVDIARKTLVEMTSSAFKIVNPNIGEALEFLVDYMVTNSPSYYVSSGFTDINTQFLSQNNKANDNLNINDVFIRRYVGDSGYWFRNGQTVPRLTVYPESFDFICTRPGTRSTSSEYLIKGNAFVPKYDCNFPTGSEIDTTLYPSGSGVSLTLNTILPNDTNRNIIRNASFDNWTNGLPNDWVVASGGADVDFSMETGTNNVYWGDVSLKLNANGGTVVFYQDITNVVVPNQLYLIGFLVRKDANASGASTVSFDVVNESDIRIQDSGDPPLEEISYQNMRNDFAFDFYGRIIRFPRIGFRVARARLIFQSRAAFNIYCDGVFLVPVQPLYKGGPAFALIQKSSPPKFNDKFSINITNETKTWNWFFERVFNSVSDYGIYLPIQGNTLIAYD